jgi:hypothetical protein
MQEILSNTFSSAALQATFHTNAKLINTSFDQVLRCLFSDFAYVCLSQRGWAIELIRYMAGWLAGRNMTNQSMSTLQTNSNNNAEKGQAL